MRARYTLPANAAKPLLTSVRLLLDRTRHRSDSTVAEGFEKYSPQTRERKARAKRKISPFLLFFHRIFLARALPFSPFRRRSVRL